jgi:hypothetical protein
MRPLPPFRTVTDVELRETYAGYSDEVIRRLCLEVVRYRRLVDDIEGYRTSIDRVWHDEVGGNLVALYQLRLLLKAERERVGVLSLVDTSDPRADDPPPDADKT